jgi:FKBP-type peptidyl-prolyl cis-trans isomerase 2
MKVSDGAWVRCDYELKVKGGEVLETSAKTGPIVYTHGAGKMLPALEAELVGLQAGDEKSGEIPAAKLNFDGPVLTIPRALFPKELKLEVGAQFEARDPQGRPLKLELQTIEGDPIKARARHPLEGLDLAYRVKILAVRKAPPAPPAKREEAPAELSADDLLESE